MVSNCSHVLRGVSSRTMLAADCNIATFASLLGTDDNLIACCIDRLNPQAVIRPSGLPEISRPALNMSWPAIG